MFDAETRGCGELRASARNRAISLSDKPTALESLIKSCCSGGSSAEIPGSRVAPEELRLKGVTTIICGPSSIESESFEIGLGLNRLRFRWRCTKVTIPITAKMAPMVPPTIAPTFLFSFFGDGELVVSAGPPAVIVLLGALEGSS